MGSDDDQVVKTAKPKAAVSVKAPTSPGEAPKKRAPRTTKKADEETKNTINKYFTKKDDSLSELDDDDIMSVHNDESDDEPVAKRAFRERKVNTYNIDESDDDQIKIKKKTGILKLTCNLNFCRVFESKLYVLD